MNPEEKAGLIKVASGQAEADMVIKNARILNVFTGEIQCGNVAVYNGYIAGIGRYDAAKETIDGEGQYLVPGFINSHCHVESSMVSPAVYCAEELRMGVTTLITDPHEIANVAGGEGIRYMLDASDGLPINYYVQLPSCVPANEHEMSGAILNASDLKVLLKEPRVLGLGELMDYYAVLRCDPNILDKLDIAEGRIIDGHAPGFTGYELNGYAAAVMSTDHESVSFAEAKEKLRAGLAVLIREGSSCKDLDAIVPGIVAGKMKTEFMAFCTDDKHLAAIRREGTIRHCVQKAIALGLPPVEAYCMASINAARIYRLQGIGAIAPGYRADMVLLSNLEKATISRVFKDGRDIDRIDLRNQSQQNNAKLENSVHIAPLTASSFELPAPSQKGHPVIGIVGGQITTKKSWIAERDVQNALDTGELCKVAVIERHHATGHIGTGLLKGYGLKGGAVASTVCHDSHNVIVAGTNNEDMLLAVMEVQSMGGGIALIRGGKTHAALPLPICGLMSDKPANVFIPLCDEILRLLYEVGISKNIDPLITLSFLAIPVIPEIRITPKGIIDVDNNS